MKILNVIHLLDPVSGGGTAERTFQMSRELAKTGNQCTILTLDINLNNVQLDKLKNVNIVILPSISKRFFIPRFSIKQLKTIIKDVDIIHLMGHWTLLNVIVYVFARYLKKPFVVCPAGALPIFGRSKLIKKIYNWTIGKKIIRNADQCIAITTDEIQHFISYKVSKNKINVIPNGISRENIVQTNDQNFTIRKGLKNHRYILFMGRLNKIKGPDLLLKAFCNIQNKINDVHLVFAGPDEGLLSDLKAIVKEKKLTHKIHFWGYIGGEDKDLAYYNAEFLTIPSRQEAMSIVVLEAGIQGTPVLITDQCGFNEIEMIQAGCVVNATIEGLEKGILKMFKRNDKMGQKLKQYIEDNFLWHAIINKHECLYKKIINNRDK